MMEVLLMEEMAVMVVDLTQLQQHWWPWRIVLAGGSANGGNGGQDFGNGGNGGTALSDREDHG